MVILPFMENDAGPASSTERTKQTVLVGILLMTILSTIALWMSTGNEAVYGAVTLFTAVGYAVGALLWCQVDSFEHSIKLGPGFRIAVVLIALIAVPYYLFKSRGFRDGMISLGFAFVYYLLLVLVASITNLILSMADGSVNIFSS